MENVKPKATCLCTYVCLFYTLHKTTQSDRHDDIQIVENASEQNYFWEEGGIENREWNE